MRNRIYSLILLLIFGVGVVSAQYSQKGYVKTRGRLSESGELIPGKRLSETSISVKDGNTVLSDNKGDFEIALTTDEYSISAVKKQGYELVDKDILWSKYKYSTNPHTLVLDNPDNIWEDRLAVESKIRDNLYKQNQAQRAEIDRLKAENRITADEYRLLRQELSDNQSKNEQLIADMAERYSTMDFDALDELNLRISHCIINGRLVEADSLLLTKGSIHSREQELRKLQEANQQEREKVNARLKRLEKSERLATSKLEDLATDCYSKFEIFKQQHKRDSAAYYIKYRAKLDEKNIKWQLDAAEYITEYVADYTGALSLLNPCIATIQKEENQSEELLAEVYGRMGDVYGAMGDYNKAIQCKNISLDIYKKHYGLYHRKTADSYFEIGSVCNMSNDVMTSISYYKKALGIYEKLDENNLRMMAACLGNLGGILQTACFYSEAIECYEGCLSIFVDMKGDDAVLSIAKCYMNMANTYSAQGNFAKGLEYYDKSLAINTKILGDNHPETALCYFNIGTNYRRQGCYDNAIQNYLKGQAILEKVFGVDHHQIAKSYRLIGGVYGEMGEYVKGLEYCNKALEKQGRILGEDNYEVVLTYNTIGEVYDKMRDYKQSIKSYKKALEIQEKINDLNIDVTYKCIGNAYYKLHNLSQALVYYNRALVNRENKFGLEHLSTAEVNVNIGVIYATQGNYSQSLEYLMKASLVQEKLLGREHVVTASTYVYMGLVYRETGHDNKALEYYNIAYMCFERFLGKEHSSTKMVKDMIYKIKSKQTK